MLFKQFGRNKGHKRNSISFSSRTAFLFLHFAGWWIAKSENYSSYSLPPDFFRAYNVSHPLNRPLLEVRGDCLSGTANWTRSEELNWTFMYILFSVFSVRRLWRVLPTWVASPLAARVRNLHHAKSVAQPRLAMLKVTSNGVQATRNSKMSVQGWDRLTDKKQTKKRSRNHPSN